MPDSPTVRAATEVVAWAVGALLVGWLSGVFVNWLARRRNSRALRMLSRKCQRPWVLVLAVWAVYNAVPPPTGAVGSAIRHVLELLLVGLTALLVVRLLYVAEDAAFQRLRIDVRDNRRTRRVRTQISIMRRLTSAVVIVLALGAMLMTFDALRTLGASLLASAGVAGAIAGLAAQTTLRNILAGLQLALTDQLRYDDVVVVEGEWGRVEELTLTHVVVRLWDERRLMLPTTYFITTPFENWTRDESRVLGAVLLHLDYLAPVEEVRAESRRIVERSPLWDRRAWVCQVVDSTPWTMVVRVLASASDGPTSWDLRCEIREALIAFLAAKHPEALPRPADPQSFDNAATDTAATQSSGQGFGRKPSQGRTQRSEAARSEVPPPT
jgi:small-conductance mechanosensitive channel